MLVKTHVNMSFIRSEDKFCPGLEVFVENDKIVAVQFTTNSGDVHSVPNDEFAKLVELVTVATRQD